MTRSNRQWHGVLFEAGRTTFSLWAPRANRMQLWLDGTVIPMVPVGVGFFVGVVEGALPEGARYAFAFENGQRRPDPASRRQPEGVHAPSQVYDPRRYRWQDQHWKGRALEELIFYELHAGTFTEAGTLDAAAERLPDLVDLGITCVELMPLQPFPGARNWGYDGVFPFAVHESYGGPEALQRFVDKAHQAGLTVCLDVVYNHLGPEGNYLAEFGPYFTPRHSSPWGPGMNFDGEDAEPVRHFVIEAAIQWVRDFHVDVLRLDAVHAISDESPRHVIAELAEAVHAVGREQGRHVHVVAESDLNSRILVERPPRGWGLDSAWADDLHHSLHALLTGERAHFFKDFGEPSHLARALTSGFVYQGQHSEFRGKRHGTSTIGLPPTAFVTCAQNHDQVGNRPHGERLSALLPWEALAPVASTILLGSGLPLLFMGEEYGETRPFLYFTSHSDPSLAQAVSKGRKAELIAAGVDDVPDPQEPSTFEASRLTHRRDGRHGELRALYQRLIALRKRYLEEISTAWPQVQVAGRVFTLSRPSLEISLNLSPSPAGNLPAWGMAITER